MNYSNNYCLAGRINRGECFSIVDWPLFGIRFMYRAFSVVPHFVFPRAPLTVQFCCPTVSVLIRLLFCFDDTFHKKVLLLELSPINYNIFFLDD